MQDSKGNVIFAALTLGGALASAVGIMMVATGRARDVYPFAVALTVAGGVVGAAHVLGGEEPPARIVPATPGASRVV